MPSEGLYANPLISRYRSVIESPIPDRIGELDFGTNCWDSSGVARENIRRFEAQLAACTDPDKRKTLSLLLDAERQRLTQTLAEKQARPEAPNEKPGLS